MSHHLFIADLKAHCQGEILSDTVSLSIYATDASMYQIQPIVVVVPTDEQDLITAVKIAYNHRIPIIPRGGGTGLAGQAIGKAMILDLSKNFRKIGSLHVDEHWVIVQPGVVRDRLNEYLAPHKLHFAPDPATSSRANIGGMIANNSSGTKSIIYGKTIDHVLELKVLLSDGTILHLKNKTKKEYDQICTQDTHEGEIYREVKHIIDANQTAIEKNFPKVMRRVGGYNLDEFIHTDIWNLSKLIVGSEGTLAIILEAKLNLTPLPSFSIACLSHFDSMIGAIRAVQEIIKYQPAAVEIIDRTVITLSRQNMATRNSCRVIEGDPAAVLIIEFHGEDHEETFKRVQAMALDLEQKNIGYAHPVFKQGPAYTDILTVRKKGLGLMIGMKSERKPVAFIEDAAIPLQHLPEYIMEVDAICNKYGVDAIKYAHASVGVIHIRPVLNLRDAADIDIFKNIAEETFLLVKKYGGSWSGEHGDGLVRSAFNERFFGSEVYQAFREIKKVFDPLELMNPGKIINAPPIDQNLRYGTQYHDEKIKTVFHYRDAGSFHNEVHMCSGIGECRKTQKGTMCPSYMATLDEEHSTRGRANLLRLAMSGQLGKDGLHSKEVYEVLDLCISCKACKSECPSNVDMAKLKSEVWQLKYDQEGISLRERFVRDSTRFARIFAGPLAPFVNNLQKTKLFRKTLESIAQIDQRRILPSYARTTFTSWYKKNYSPPKNIRNSVFLFVDTYLNYHDPEVGISAVRLLINLGIHTELAEVGCCQRPRISNGFLHLAKTEGEKLAENLKPFLTQGKPILVCEPSCASALQFDLPDLLDDPDLSQKMSAGFIPIADYIWNKIVSEDHLSLNIKKPNLYLHGHCHEKALYNITSIKNIIEKCGGKIKVIDSGCCGMAGVFGYEKEHYEMSEKIGRSRLLDVIDKTPKDSFIIADGFSCRHQIEHFTGRKAHFWTEVFE